MKRFIFVTAVCVSTLIGAGSYAAAKNDSSAAPSQTPPPAIAAPANNVLSGKVLETMNSGGYTYISIERNGGKIWVAIPMTEVKVGQVLTFQPGAEMGNFKSKSLNRTFDNIIFSGGLAAKGGPAPAGSPHGAGAAAAPKSGEKISVAKATGPDAYTVSEVFAKSAALHEKTAVVRGKVVKVSEAIMGKNWVHVQDGTGDAAKGNNKLVATTQDLPKVGDVVTLKGTIYKDKDFGSGYKYNVIMEQASVTK